MINIKVNEGYAYDLLAIAQIKKDKNLDNSKAFDNFCTLSQDISSQVGETLHIKILNSIEYTLLYKVNEELYLKIDDLKSCGEKFGDATFIDKKNYERWIAKSNLQKKWFGQTVNEQKFGYKNE